MAHYAFPPNPIPLSFFIFSENWSNPHIALKKFFFKIFDWDTCQLQVINLLLNCSPDDCCDKLPPIFISDQYSGIIRLRLSHDPVIMIRFRPVNECVDIQINNTETMEKYSQIIDAEYISKRENLDCIRDLAEIYEFLT